MKENDSGKNDEKKIKCVVNNNPTSYFNLFEHRINKTMTGKYGL